MNQLGNYDLQNLIYFAVIGLVAGWIASKIMKGRGSGLIRNLIIGIIGAFLGGWLFDFLNIQIGGICGMLIAATSGSIVLLWLIRLISR